MRPKHSLSSARRRLDDFACRGIDWIYQKGYFWIRDLFAPSVTLVAMSGSSVDRRRLALALYMMGDIYDFNQAPRAAVRAYQRSNEFLPNAAAFREIGTCEYEMGFRKRSIRSLQLAASMDPNDPNTAQELALISGQTITPSYRSDDPVWQAREAIATGKPRAAIRILKGMNSMRSLQALSCAYAVDLDILNYIRTWEAIRRRSSKEKLKPERSLWFFLPPAVDASPEFWDLVMSMQSEIRSGYVPAERFWVGSLSVKTEQRARKKYFQWRYELALDRSC